jgi:hypothetical protein
MKLRHVVLHPGKYRMEVLVEDPDGKARLIEVSWYAKAQTDVPPANWWEMVQGEVELKRAEELAARQGRTLL